MDRRYVPLRPLRPSATASSHQGELEDGIIQEPDAKKRRINTTIACDSCRQRKIKCDGRRPICSACRGRTGYCLYRDENGLSKDTSEAIVEVFHILGQESTADAANIIDSLKDEASAGVILSTLRGEMAYLPSGPSDTSPYIDDEEDDDDLGSLELETQNPVAYPHEPRPTQAGTMRRGSSEKRSQADTEEPIVESPEIKSTSPAPPSSHSSHSFGENTQSDAPRLCDSRLSRLDIHLWTNVDIDNDLAARCISLYLETDHPLLGHFDADLFVTHLVTGQHEHCSSLLVNSLLYFASQMYSAYDHSTDGLAIHFCQEAESLWNIEIDKGNDSPLNIAAAEFLSLGYLGQGRDHSVLRYMTESAYMGCRMGFFGIKGYKNEEESNLVTSASPKIRKSPNAYKYAAWGVFNWLTLMSLFYHQPGVLCPSHPPRLPIPGEDELTNTTNLKNTHQDYIGDTFPYLCRFWSIMREVSCMYHASGQLPWGNHATLMFAEYKFRELLAWSNRLPRPMHASRHGPHHVQVMHLWFHAAILDIFRPFISDKLRATSQLRTFASSLATPKAASEASLTQLKALIMAYRHSQPSSSYSLLWHTAMIHSINAFLEDENGDAKDKDWYSHLLLCLYGYQRLNRSWRVAKSISRALLSLTLRSGRIPVNVARKILFDLERSTPARVPEEIRATFMVDLEQSLSEPQSATVERLAEQLEENIWLKEYTTFFDETGPN